MPKHQMILDPDADSSQWIYRDNIIMKQEHPKLLLYACFDNLRDGFVIGACCTRKGAKFMIDKYLSKDGFWNSSKVFFK